MNGKKLIYWIENLRLGLKYRSKLARDSGDEPRVDVYNEVIKDLDKILEIK